MGTNDSRIGSSQTRTKKMGRIVRNDLYDGTLFAEAEAAYCDDVYFVGYPILLPSALAPQLLFVFETASMLYVPLLPIP